MLGKPLYRPYPAPPKKEMDIVLMCANNNISDLLFQLSTGQVINYKVHITEGKFEGVENITFIIEYDASYPANLTKILGAAKRLKQKSVLHKAGDRWSHISVDGEVLQANLYQKEHMTKPSHVESWTKLTHYIEFQ